VSRTGPNVESLHATQLQDTRNNPTRAHPSEHRARHDRGSVTPAPSSNTLAAAAELRHVDLADALSLVLLIRDDAPPRHEHAAVRWLSRYATLDCQLRLGEARELVDLLDGVGRRDQVAAMRRRQVAAASDPLAAPDPVLQHRRVHGGERRPGAP
jgi:hypothetical protein